MDLPPLFTFFNSESVRSAKSMSRFLKLFTSKSKPGPKGKTIKKPALAPVVKIDTVDQDASNCQLNSEDITFPREYYTPRPISKSFVVSEVRKLTNNGSQSDPLVCHTQAFKPEQATAVKVVDTLHHLSELDPQAFELYKIYLLSNKIAFRYLEDISPGYAWVACWPLMNAHILGCIIGEPDFADRAMDTLVETLTAGICPDSDTIEHLFNNGKEGIPEMLKLFAINRFIEAQQQSHDSIHRKSDTLYKLGRHLQKMLQ
ncbi:hypothetical protein SLS59_002525 [Nothophoma quercina]|uniref:Uncharacterized protein n=1 Tax=Nothophoma quercina TaxID=749835 RepID=A0ABR3RUD1_9PLEO